MKEENIVDLGEDGDIAKGEKPVDKKPKQPVDFRNKPKKSPEEKQAEQEISEEEKAKLETEKQKRIKARAEEIKRAKEKARLDAEAIEAEIAKVKNSRMNKLDKENFLPKFTCPKCQTKLEVFVSKKPHGLVLWAMCEKCEVKQNLSVDEARKINNPIYFYEIEDKHLFVLSMLKMPTTITPEDIQQHRAKQK